jgi:hypothetical protein
MKTAFAPLLPSVPRIIGFALFLSFALFCHAQQASDAVTSQSDRDQQLVQRINELEAKVKQLEERQAAPAPTPAPVVEGPRQNSVNDRLKLNVFGDVGYEANV